MNYLGENARSGNQSFSRLCRCKLLQTLGSQVSLDYLGSFKFFLGFLKTNFGDLISGPQ